MSDDPARGIAQTIASALSGWLGALVDGIEDEHIESAEMYGMASVQVTVADGRTFLVDVNEGSLA